jgi:Rod binding domain-containing protein
MDPVSSSTTPALASLAAVVPKPSKIEDAAQQFESLLIAQMLRSARESGSGGLDGDENDSESATMLDVADQQFATLLSHQGGLGLTNLVVQGLKKDQS